MSRDENPGVDDSIDSTNSPPIPPSRDESAPAESITNELVTAEAGESKSNSAGEAISAGESDSNSAGEFDSNSAGEFDSNSAGESDSSSAGEADSSSENSKRGKPSLISHVVWLTLACGVVLASMFLEVQDSTVRLPGLGSSLPGLCTFKRMTGLDCPGCGLTRCFISVGHGRLADATQFNPVGILLYVFVVVQIPFRLLQIFRIKNGWEELQWYEAGTWIVIGIAFLLLGQWVVRIVGSMLLGW